MNSPLAADLSARHAPTPDTHPPGANEAPWPSLAMSRPDHLPQIIQRLAVPAGVVVRVRYPIDDVIVR